MVSHFDIFIGYVVFGSCLCNPQSMYVKTLTLICEVPILACVKLAMCCSYKKVYNGLQHQPCRKW